MINYFIFFPDLLEKTEVHPEYSERGGLDTCQLYTIYFIENSLKIFRNCPKKEELRSTGLAWVQTSPISFVARGKGTSE